MKIISVIFGKRYFTDAHRALELLEEYHSTLSGDEDTPLRSAIERVIRIFRSRLFQALLGECVCVCVCLSIFVNTLRVSGRYRVKQFPSNE